MNLVTLAALRNNTINGKKLTTSQINLFDKLDKMGTGAAVNVEPVIVENPINGVTSALDPFIASLVVWVQETYSTYRIGSPMNYNGHSVSIAIFDRVKYLVLALDSNAYSNFID